MILTAGLYVVPDPVLDTPKFQDVYLQLTHNISISFGCHPPFDSRGHGARV